jgi:hypothetical protein
MSRIKRALTAVRRYLFWRGNPPTTRTVPCAAQCGQPVGIGGPHYSVLRNVERVLADDEIETLDGDYIAVVHIGCWPGLRDQVVIHGAADGPDNASVRSAATS